MNRTRTRHCLYALRLHAYVHTAFHQCGSRVDCSTVDENWNRKSDFIDENGRKKRRAYRINATPYDDHADCAKASAACSILEASATFTFHLGEARRLAARRFTSRTFARTRNGKRRRRNGEQRTVDNVRVFLREEQRVVIGTRPLSAWRAHDRSSEYARYRHDSVSPSCRDESNPHPRDIDGKHPGMQPGIPLVTREKRQCFEFS